MLGTREGKYRWALHFDKYTSVTILGRHLLHGKPPPGSARRLFCSVHKMIPDAMEQQGKPLAKFRTRRFKANARERHRMHALNSALDRLRSCMPVQCKSHKLSKIETLRLARNYIFALSSVVQGSNDPLVFARSLTQGISQSTCNLIANSLNASLRNLHLHDNTASNEEQQNLFSNWSGKGEQSALFLAENPLDTFMYDWS